MESFKQLVMKSGRSVFFFVALSLFLLNELASVYLIMPLPGSQETNSLGLAYFLYTWRWVFRCILVAIVVVSYFRANWKRKWVPLAFMLTVALATYIIQFRMSADHMFHPPENLILKDPRENEVDLSRLVIGIEKDGQARAYPIRFLSYHHQIPDTFAGKPVLVTYCTVCRSGRVFDPVIGGKPEIFRLVGMDHFNAMLEDRTTGSWWRQATGEAVTGPRKGMRMAEIFSMQTSLREWIALYPQTLVMQADPAYLDKYDTTRLYETGRSRSRLTGTDSLSWNRKSWVVGVSRGSIYRAYDWNDLLRERILEDTLGGAPVLLVLSADSSSFFAFDKPSPRLKVMMLADTILIDGRKYRLNGSGIDTAATLRRLPAYQEFWHSWDYFHPKGSRYPGLQSSK